MERSKLTRVSRLEGLAVLLAMMCLSLLMCSLRWSLSWTWHSDGGRCGGVALNQARIEWEVWFPSWPHEPVRGLDANDAAGKLEYWPLYQSWGPRGCVLLWPLVAIAFPSLVGWAVWRARIVWFEDRCASCRYPRTGLGPEMLCPECGAPHGAVK